MNDIVYRHFDPVFYRLCYVDGFGLKIMAETTHRFSLFRYGRQNRATFAPSRRTVTKKIRCRQYYACA